MPIQEKTSALLQYFEGQNPDLERGRVHHELEGFHLCDTAGFKHVSLGSC